MIDSRSLDELKALEIEGINVINDTLKEISPASETVEGVHSALEGSGLTITPPNSKDIKARLMLKYFLIDIDIFNTHDSKF